jgi:alpha-galactosidase
MAITNAGDQAVRVSNLFFEAPAIAVGPRIGYDTDVFPFERTIEPGETFTSAASGIALFQEDRGFADPHSPWLYNTWDGLFERYDATVIEETVPVAARMGFDILTLDTGWSANDSDQIVDPHKFPSGLDGVRSARETQGMRLGLWMPLAVVSRESRVYREHPEWTMRDQRGGEKSAAFPGKADVLLCLASPYREVAARHLNALIASTKASGT